MMKTQDPCDPAIVAEFLNSPDYRIEDSAFIEHLDKCGSCQRMLEEQAADSATWEHLIATIKPKEYDEAGTAEFSAATIFGEVQAQPVAIQDVLDTLTPSEQPEHLGRLSTYEITGVVGVGGMGVVLKGIDASLDRVVAIKVMAPRLANNELARQRFAREAKAAAAVHHPNVIPIHSVCSDGKLPFFVMTYVRGESLQKRLNREGPLSLVEVLRIGSQIAAGLSAAHGQGLVHRDIKPENILMEEGVERVTITDFGLARAVDDNTVTQQGTIAGTPQYMSPEQARGEKLDQQTDLFSLGSVLYSMCAGRPPYQAESSYGVMRKIIDQSPTPLRQLSPTTPEWLAQIVRKLMHRDKESRVQTANEAQAMLEGCLNYIQQPSVLHLPPEVQNLHVEPTADVRNGTIKESKTSKKTRSSVVVLSSALMLLLAGLAFTPIRGMLTGMFADDPAFLSVGGGALQNSDGWSILSGSSYFENDQPAVMFGLHEMPDSNRELTYAIVFRHSATEQSDVASSATSGLSFDGEVVRGTGGVTVNGIGFQSVLDLQVSNQVDKAEIRIGGTKYDLSQGNIFFIDLTDRSVPVRQMAVAPMEKLPDPTDLSGDTNLVLQFAKDMIGDLAAKDANVAGFLKACRDPKVATPQALFSAEPQEGMESKIPPRWSATLKSARIELMQLRMSESDLLARFKESHPEVLMVRKRIKLLEKMIPEIPKDESYFPAASKQLNELMELRFRESDLYHSGRSTTAEFRSLQGEIRELRNQIAEIESEITLQKQLAGEWQVFACWLSGEPSSPTRDEMTFEFRGDKMILSSKGNRDQQATFKITNAKPYPQIDYSSDGVLYQGIFDLRGDILQIVASQNARPTTMRMAGGAASRVTDMFIMKRSESAKVDALADQDRYLAEQITFRGIVQNADKGIDIWFSTTPEPLWYCPGVDIVTHEQGYELIFPRWNALDSSRIDVKAEKSGDDKSAKRIRIRQSAIPGFEFGGDAQSNAGFRLRVRDKNGKLLDIEEQIRNESP